MLIVLLILLLRPILGVATSGNEKCSPSDKYEPVSETQLPDPWKFANGKPVVTAADFACRQAEMSKILQQFELGDFPPPPDSLQATCRPSYGEPAMIGIGGVLVPTPPELACIIFANDACAAQSGASSRGRGWFYDLHGSSYSAGALRAWAWAWCVGRIVDGLEQLGAATTGINPARLGITGCSRNGKGALIAGAFEKRITLTVPQESGAGGCPCWRMYDAELNSGRRIIMPPGGGPSPIWSIVSENVWFSQMFNEFVRNISAIPADHHFLPAMVAPRGLFISENNIDWLAPASSTGCMRAGRAIYNGVGVKTSMGFALRGGHNHCMFPAAGEADLLSFINRFLLGKGEPNDVDVSIVQSSLSSWVGRWSAAPNITLSGG
ncbi:hypothetical protein B0T14DRAFT_539365 [Immersiella caudata]|uniref:(4-O-methyl)-D-glucuronate--lignin esterase n=1 Tax=Immersiella caudata TaxID=314043 RepID=A0AA39WDS9_9PEZI|nr:hypothetical protein B0T14DRAFT_539365 [Immersiella caudata]